LVADFRIEDAQTYVKSISYLKNLLIDSTPSGHLIT